VSHVRLRHLVHVNPSSPAFDDLPSDAELTFLPMEKIWPDDRLDLSERRTKSSVTTGYTRFQHGDVLVPKITPTFEASRSVLITDGLLNGTGAGTTELHILRAGPEIDPRFLLYITHSHPFLKMGEAEMYGVAGQKRVPDEFIRNFTINLLTLDEQRRIVEYLDAETARISLMERLQHTLLDKLNERDQAFIDRELDRLESRHGVRRFKWAIRRIEQGFSPQCHNIPADRDRWGVLKVSSVKNGRFWPEENKQLPDTIAPDQRFEVRPGDLLITRANTPSLVGAAAVVPEIREKLLLCDKIYRITLTPELDPHFVVLASRGSKIRNLCAAASHGTSQSMANLKTDEVKEWPIPNIDIQGQRLAIKRVADQQAATNALRGKIYRQLELLKERRRALITAAVTGQFDVATASRTTD
jgi:hypothetical protein